MKINVRIWILSLFVFTLLSMMMIRTCERPPKKGEEIFMNHCASCHGNDGEGFRNLIPPLTDAKFLQENRDEFGCIVAYGISRKIEVNGKTYRQPMYGISELSATEIANVGNYIYEKWGIPKKNLQEKI